MSSLVERLRVRSVRRPSYNDDDWDDDLEAPPPKAAGHAPANPPERLTRNDAVRALSDLLPLLLVAFFWFLDLIVLKDYFCLAERGIVPSLSGR